jgi:hypothetical protein
MTGKSENERLKEWCRALIENEEIAALKAERDDLKRQLTALPVYDPSYGDAVALITDLKAERDRLLEALGYIDDVARRALEGK